MPTKHLSTTSKIAPTLLAPQEEGVLEVEVPAGESRFLIRQTDSDSQAQAYIFHLRHPDSTVQILGLVKAATSAAPRLSTKVVHHAPRTRAETIVRTLATDQAQPRYEGLIHITKPAQNAESYLNHHSLLLGTTAKSWTLPSLEIEADQVKCSHAATMRTITEQDLFYLRSRGIEPEVAQQLLIEAFLADTREIPLIVPT